MAEYDNAPPEPGSRGLAEVAARIRQGGDELVATAGTLAEQDRGVTGFGGDGPGRLGELGRDLHRLWAVALAARSGEASRHGNRLVEVATTLGRVVTTYTEADAAVADDLSRSAPDPGVRPRSGPGTGAGSHPRPDTGTE